MIVNTNFWLVNIVFKYLGHKANLHDNRKPSETDFQRGFFLWNGQFQSEFQSLLK